MFVNIIFFKDLFIFVTKSDIQRGGETEWKIFCVSHMGAGSQVLRPSSTAFPGHKQGAGWEVKLPGLDPAPIWDPSAIKARTLVTRPRRRAPVNITYVVGEDGT